MHQRILALAIAIGAQRQDQIILVLPIDGRDCQRRIVDVVGVATIALGRDVLEQRLAVFGGFSLLRRIVGDDVVDFLVGEIGYDAIVSFLRRVVR